MYLCQAGLLGQSDCEEKERGLRRLDYACYLGPSLSPPAAIGLSHKDISNLGNVIRPETAP